MSYLWDRITHMSPDEQRALQNKRIAHFFRHELSYSPFYRALFEKHDIDFKSIRTVDDVQRIPFTTKADIAPTPDDKAKPRTFMLQPDEHLIKKYAPASLLAKVIWGKITRRDVKRMLERLYKPIHLHFTTGRSALPTAFGYTESDIEILKEAGERMFSVANVSRDKVAINAFPYAPHLAFWQAYNALVQLGITSLQTGGGKVMGSQKIMDALEGMKAGLFICIPGYGYHLLREAVKQKRNFSGLETFITGGERASEGMRVKVKSLLAQLGAPNVRFLSTYAFTEAKTAWIQCHEKSGYHLYPDLGYFEVIDKDGKRVPDGQPGELVYTSIGWRGSVVVRYRTGDMTTGIEYRPCQYCGRTVPRIGVDLQRTTEIKEFHLTKVKGELVNLNDFYPLLSGLPEVEEWQVEISKKDNDPHGLDEITIYLAPKTGVDFAQLERTVNKLVHNQIFVTAAIRQKPLDELLRMLGMETELKEKRIVDNRPKD